MKGEHLQSNAPTSALAVGFGLWAGVLLYLFVLNRGADLGILKSQVEIPPVLPIFGSAVLESVAGLLAALLIGLAWFGTGSVIAALLPPMGLESRPRIFEFAIQTSLGAAFWTLAFFFLGLAGGFNVPAACIVTAIGIGGAVYGFRQLAVRAIPSEEIERLQKVDVVLFALTSIPVALALITALAPPIAKDTLLYHFSVPKAFVSSGGLVHIEGNIASYMTLSSEMHIVWAMLLGGVSGPRAAEAAAGAVIWLFLPILLLAVYGWARTLNLSRRWSVIAALMVAAVPTVYYVAASGYIDLASTLFVTLAIFAFGQWSKTPDRAWVLLTGVFLGSALAAKLVTLFVFAPLALIILWRARGESEGTAKVVASGFTALVLAILIAAPWYVRTWVETGSPLFPFYTSVWKGDAVGWDVERSSLIQQKDAQYGGLDKKPIDYLLAPLSLSFNSQPDLVTHFDGVLGVGFLFGLSVLGLALWRFELPLEPKIAATVAFIAFLFWMFSSQQLRYLLPIFPMLAVATVIAARSISERVGGFRRVTVASMAGLSVVGILVTVSWFLQVAPARTVLGGEARESFLTRNLDYYPYYEVLNAQAGPASKVWLINMRRDSYHLNAEVVGDYLFEDWTLRRMVWESADLNELKAKARSLGIQYVLTRHDFMFDIERSTIVDEQRTRIENEQKLRLARDFVLEAANVIRSDEKFSLIKVF